MRRQSASEARNTTSKGMVLKVRPKGCVISGCVMSANNSNTCVPRPATIRALGPDVAVLSALVAPLVGAKGVRIAAVAASLELGSEAFLGFIGCLLEGVLDGVLVLRVA